MGRSGKPDIAYSFDDHARYLDAWFDHLGLDRVVLVGHDWGGALAFDWATRHPERVRGLAFAESIVKPMGWDEVSPQARARTEKIRSPEGENLYLDQDLFVRQAFTGGVLTPVSEQDLKEYLAPYPPATAAGRCWPGLGSCRWAVNRPGSSRGSRLTTPGSRPARRCPSC